MPEHWMNPVVPIVIRARFRNDGFRMICAQLLGRVRSMASYRELVGQPDLSSPGTFLPVL